ncbi:uncharacterized protein LOC113218390, partial [Frankliniella occidentalis]|uniref:Uncharacterized protein LOC113218390 n=1 Tax=Frankliniella occidentalis TaxID=133901 RepID=A0A9C6X8T5_FRAOC
WTKRGRALPLCRCGWRSARVLFNNEPASASCRSNCHPSILAGMRREYARPQFLPLDAEHAHHDFIFMGYSQGAAMHLDYISRLMWQAQLKGHKTWMLTPPPECEHVCSSFSFRAAPGDVVLLDTRQWYHKTQIDEKEFSLTVSSEYG